MSFQTSQEAYEYLAQNSNDIKDVLSNNTVEGYLAYAEVCSIVSTLYKNNDLMFLYCQDRINKIYKFFNLN
jgi:hypothetical protein